MHFNQANLYCDLTIENLSSFVLVIVTKIWSFAWMIYKKQTFSFKIIIATQKFIKIMHKTCITGNLSFEVEFSALAIATFSNM